MQLSIMFMVAFVVKSAIISKIMTSRCKASSKETGEAVYLGWVEDNTPDAVTRELRKVSSIVGNSGISGFLLFKITPLTAEEAARDQQIHQDGVNYTEAALPPVSGEPVTIDGRSLY